ncbi:hypothetical protein XENOCAPTIV_028775 [Xenoophorus captivus]|uniref:Uncharacterized protein n=1 Tax=Xenoophorus captivus TaxID=1517983 RepID=A0ABV0S414_9TELE
MELDYFGDFGLGNTQIQLRVVSLCFHQGRCDSRIEETLEVLLSPPGNVPCRGQQLPTPTVNSVGEALLLSPEAPDSLPELFQGGSPPWPNKVLLGEYFQHLKSFSFLCEVIKKVCFFSSPIYGN